jgi:hypothetical protein
MTVVATKTLIAGRGTLFGVLAIEKKLDLCPG